MKATSLLAAIAMVLAIFPASSFAQAEPPGDFLQTRIPVWNHVLGTKITVNFRNATIGEVAQFLGNQTSASIVVDVSARKKIPLITRKFHHVPLRTALYLISQDAGLEVDWIYAGKLPQVIRIH